METLAVLDDCGINCPSSPSSLVDDIAFNLEEFKALKKEKEEQKRKIEEVRQFILDTADGNETSPSLDLGHLRFLRQDFYRNLAAVIEELTVTTLAAILEAERQLQFWRRSTEASSRSRRYISKISVSGKDALMSPVFRVRLEDRQAHVPVCFSRCSNRRLAKRKLQEKRSDAIFLAQLKAVGKTALIEALEKERLTDTEFDRLWAELQKQPRELDKRYFYAGGTGFCEFARTRAVQSKPKNEKKKKGKQKGKQRGN